MQTENARVTLSVSQAPPASAASGEAVDDAS